MGQKEKLIAKLRSRPKDFTFEEAETLLGFLSYERNNKGKTSGSRVMFESAERKTKIMTQEEKRSVAYHEAGHATISWRMSPSSGTDKSVCWTWMNLRMRMNRGSLTILY